MTYLSAPPTERVMKKIVIGTDQPLLARGLENALRSHGFLVVAIAGDFASLRQAIQGYRPAAALLDAPVLPTLEAAGELQRLEPSCILVLRGREITPEFRNRAAFQGVRAILPAGIPPEQLAQVLGILTSFPAGGLTSIDVYQSCDQTERRVISLAARGMETREISAALRFPEPAVRALLNGVLRRLDIRDRYELTLHVLASTCVSKPSSEENRLWKNETAIVSH